MFSRDIRIILMTFVPVVVGLVLFMSYRTTGHLPFNATAFGSPSAPTGPTLAGTNVLPYGVRLMLAQSGDEAWMVLLVLALGVFAALSMVVIALLLVWEGVQSLGGGTAETTKGKPV